MKKIITAVLIIGLILVAGWLISGTESTKYIAKQAQETAETWIKNNSLTFIERGGSNLTHVKTQKISKNTFEVVFSFKTDFAGYGPVAEDEMNAQVITPHTIVVTIEEGEVSKVITDETYNEIKEKQVGENENIEENSQTVTLHFQKLVDGKETIVEEEREVSFDSEGGVEKAALLALLEGPNKEGLTTSINENTELLSLKIEDGVAKADFSSEIEPGGGSAWVTSIRDQITKTLMQFDSVNKVKILIEGEENRLQP